ncbi:MAG TPA: hypothetical protein VEC60_00010 [Reyranella sp.]|nr:hypothetical protein [Reyranella sp.]
MAQALWALLLCFGLSGCIVVSSHSAFQRIHDNQITYDDFNDTMDVDLVDDAFPPLPVHEFDHDQVEDAGGYRAIDGFDWFAADDEERGDLLAEIEDDMPPGSVIVIEVATGDVWVVPADAYQVFFDGMMTAWTEDEYDDLPDYVYDTPGFGFYGPTLSGYQQLTAVAEDGPLRPVVYMHPLVRSAIARLAVHNAVSFALMPHWHYLTPIQRLALLHNLQNYLLMTAAFRNNPFLFGVSIPDGRIYAFPDMPLWQIAAIYTARAWMLQEILALSSTGILPALVSIRRAELIRQFEPRD